MTRSAPVLYEMSPIGVDGKLEAVGTLFFCSEACRTEFRNDRGISYEPLAEGTDADWIEETVCETCEMPLREVRQ